MAAVRSSRTDLEEKLSKEMWAVGLRGWRRHSRVEGTKPDFFFGAQARVAVFVDGCFWHGCPNCAKTPATNREYWLPKIQRNRERDAKQSAVLRANGHRVIRFWGHEIEADSRQCAHEVASIVAELRRRPSVTRTG